MSYNTEITHQFEALCVGVAFFLFSLSPGALAQSDLYFWNWQERETLLMSLDKVGVRFVDGIAEEVRGAFLEQELGVGPDEEILDLDYRNPIGNVLAVPVQGLIDEAALLGTVAQLIASDSVYYAAPVFAAPALSQFDERIFVRTPEEAAQRLDRHRSRLDERQGFSLYVAPELFNMSAAAGIYPDSYVVERLSTPEVVLSNKLAVQFDDEDAESELLQMIQQEGIVLLSRSIFSNGVVHTELSVELETGLEALDLANRLLETGLVVRSGPVFLPLGSVEFYPAPPELIPVEELPEEPPEEGYFYYGIEGDIIILELSVTTLGVRLAEGVTLEDFGDLVTAHPDLVPLEDEALQESLAFATGFELVALRAGMTPLQVEGLIASLGDNALVSLVTPVFSLPDGYQVLLGDTLYASFSSETAEEDVYELINSYSLEVVSINDFSTCLGKVGYRLRVTEWTGLNALDMAAIFHENPLTLGASPSLYSLHPDTLSVSSPGTGAGNGEGEGESCSGNLLSNPGFEDETAFGPLICSLVICPGFEPRSGTYWLQFHGRNTADVLSTEQSVFIPEGEEATLIFYVRAPGVPVGDHFGVSVDGETASNISVTKDELFEEYTLVSVDVSAYADGAAHVIEFANGALTPGGSFQIDDMCLTVNTGGGDGDGEGPVEGNSEGEDEGFRFRFPDCSSAGIGPDGPSPGPGTFGGNVLLFVAALVFLTLSRVGRDPLRP